MIAEASAAMASRGGADPVGALASLLAPGGALAASCRFCYELRLHRARGYGALKAILDVLAEEEPLTLTEIALRLRTQVMVRAMEFERVDRKARMIFRCSSCPQESTVGSEASTAPALAGAGARVAPQARSVPGQLGASVARSMSASASKRGSA
jgi:hypothetical protein